MSVLSTGLPSGLRVSADGVVWVEIPLTIEAADGSAAQRTAILDGFVTDMKAKSPDVALVRAEALMTGQDPAVAETTFTAAQRAGPVVSATAIGDPILGE